MTSQGKEIKRPPGEIPSVLSLQLSQKRLGIADTSVGRQRSDLIAIKSQHRH